MKLRRAQISSIGSKTYPYAYASADATPLYIITMNDYVTKSGDIAFAQAKMGQHLESLPISALHLRLARLSAKFWIWPRLGRRRPAAASEN